MAEPTDGSRPADFVPASFEDLRRDTRSDRPDYSPTESRLGRQDFGALVANRGFMQSSKWISIGAVGIGALLILAAYARPLFDTADAVQTATVEAADKASSQVRAVQGAADGVARKAAFMKDTDIRAINMAKGGLGCLSGQGGCPNGSSPFR